MMPETMRHIVALPAIVCLALAPLFAMAANPDAVRIQFDNATNGFTATNAQKAIEEAKLTAPGTNARYGLNFGYNGTANVGRWLDYFAGVASNDGPFIPANAVILHGFSFVCKTSTTVTIGIYKNNVLWQTLALVSGTYVFYGDYNSAANAGDRIAMKTESGTCSQPVATLFMETQI